MVVWLTALGCKPTEVGSIPSAGIFMTKTTFALYLALVASLAALTFVTVLLFAKDDDSKPTEAVKIKPSSAFERVQGLMNYRFSSMQKTADEIIWDFQGTQVSEQTLFSDFGITTKKQKKAFRDEAVKNKGKRLRHVCYMLQSNTGDWSLGYCYDKAEPYLGES